MKVGSLVVPTIDYGSYNGDTNVKMTPFYPNPNTVCTISAIHEREGIEIEEVEVYISGNKWWFNKEFWKEIQPPQETNESVEEVKEILENSSVATV